MNPEERKNYPVFTGLIKYFPHAILETSRASVVGNTQHVLGEPLHWDMTKSIGHGDQIMRHIIDSECFGEKFDTDGTRHLGKAAWRILELLERQILAEKGEVKINEKKEALFDSIQEHIAKTTFLQQKKRGRPRKITN